MAKRTDSCGKSEGCEVNLRGIDHLVAQSVARQDPITFAGFAKRHQEELTRSASEMAA